jgi:hypothetical protein
LFFIVGERLRRWLVLIVVIGFLGLPSLAGPGAGGVAKAKFRPAFGAVVKVAIDEGLGFVLGLVRYSDYIL